MMPCLLTSFAFLQFLVVVNTRALAPRVTEVHWFWASIFLSSQRTIGIRIRVSLFHTEVLLFRNPYRLFQGVEFQPEQVGFNRTNSQTLHKQRNQRLLVQWVDCYATDNVTYVLNVRVYVTFTLLDSQEFRASPELSSRRLKCLPQQGLKDFQNDPKTYGSCNLRPKAHVFARPAKFD